MATKKKDNNGEEMVVLRTWKGQRSAYLARPATLLGAVTMASDLVTQGRPEAMGAAAEAAFDDVVEMRGRGQAALDRLAAATQSGTAEPRYAVMTAHNVVTSSLDLLVRSGIEPLASEARAVTSAVFGDSRPELSQLGPREVTATVERVHDRLVGSVALRKRLDALVRPELTERLLTQYAALAKAVAALTLNAADPVDQAAMAALVNDAVNHLAICVLASAPPRDAGKVAKATAFLRPILAHRADNARRLARRGRRVVVEVAEEDEPETPAPPAIDDRAGGTD